MPATILPVTTRRVELPRRVTLDIAETGNTDGSPVVLLHGITDSWRSYELLFAELPSSIRAIAVSQRGHGDSDRPDDYATRAFADDIAALLDTLGITDATIVGHSMGSIVARRFAVDHPQRTRALVLAGTFAGFAGRDDMAEFAEVVNSLSDPIDPDFIREFQASTGADGLPTGFFEVIVAESCKVPARVFQQALACIYADDVMDELERIAAPTLIAWGDRDPYCPRADQDAILAGIADARLSIYEGISHNPHWERPERFARELVSFVGEAR